MNAASPKTQHYFFLAIFIAAAWLMFEICRPFINSLVLAGSLAIVFYPIFHKINHALKGRRSLASIFTLIIIMVLVFTPLLIIGSLLFGEVRSLYLSIVNHSGGAGGINQMVGAVQDKLRIFLPDVRLDVAYYAEQALQWTFLNLNTFFSSFVGILLNGFVMIVALFFFLRDGKKLHDKLLVWSPLGDKYGEGIFTKIVSAVNSVVKGSLVVAIVQGVFASVGFALLGVPNPIIWGVTAMIASLIPGFGTALVTVPCIIYLYFTAPLWHTLALAAWALGGVGLIDNFITPSILNRGMKIHPFLVLLSVLGGIAFFGPIGFIIGPIMLAFFFALLDIYPLIMHHNESALP